MLMLFTMIINGIKPQGKPLTLCLRHMFRSRDCGVLNHLLTSSLSNANAITCAALVSSANKKLLAYVRNLSNKKYIATPIAAIISIIRIIFKKERGTLPEVLPVFPFTKKLNTFCLKV